MIWQKSASPPVKRWTRQGEWSHSSLVGSNQAVRPESTNEWPRGRVLRSRESPCYPTGRHITSRQSDLPVWRGIWTSHLYVGLHGSLNPKKSAPKTASWSVQPFLHRLSASPTKWHTDHAITCNMCISGVHLRTACVRCGLKRLNVLKLGEMVRSNEMVGLTSINNNMCIYTNLPILWGILGGLPELSIWVHFVWPDPTPPISWLTQRNPTHYKWKNLDPIQPNTSYKFNFLMQPNLI